MLSITINYKNFDKKYGRFKQNFATVSDHFTLVCYIFLFFNVFAIDIYPLLNVEFTILHRSSLFVSEL